jgi:hypothetical protein
LKLLGAAYWIAVTAATVFSFARFSGGLFNFTVATRNQQLLLTSEKMSTGALAPSELFLDIGINLRSGAE